MLDNLWLGLITVLAWKHLLFMVAGAFFGLWIGVIPGLGPVMAMAILIPVTFAMDPLSGLLMLASIHAAGTYGGSVSAIMINVPGDPGSAATTFDGYALARQGKVLVALGLSVCASMIGGMVGVVALIAAAQPLAEIALTFGPPEYFALALLGLSVVAAATGGSVFKGLLMGCLGLAVSFIGTDSVLGFARFTFGVIELEAKIDFVPVVIGLFAVSELMMLMVRGGTISESGKLEGSLWDGIRLVFAYPLALLRGIVTGIFVGIVPGIGAVTANLLAYAIERRQARDPSRFGKGAPQGVIGPESANNACVTAAIIPTVTLGVPGSAGAAILLVALTIHGLRPGPALFTGSTDLIYGFFVGLIISQLLFAVMGVLFTRWFAVVTVVPSQVLAPALLVISLVGAYAYQQQPADVVVAILFGLIGFAAQRLRYPVIGLVMGLVLGEMAETAFHQSLQISDGSYRIFVSRPLSASIIALSAGLVLWPIIFRRKGS
ncbi:MAG TPA: tripartite tricarboxylate transporter permease [Burkholderiales bacterium]|jgi:putative tricarboxylic transport membrane protein|nr:tripartite tricarboxylate transporter permease [Burkholderiales bacterium]